MDAIYVFVLVAGAVRPVRFDAASYVEASVYSPVRNEYPVEVKSEGLELAPPTGHFDFPLAPLTAHNPSLK